MTKQDKQYTIPVSVHDVQRIKDKPESVRDKSNMNWEQLLHWAMTKGKDESDVLDWYALSECQSIRDMSDREMVDMLRAGIKYDRAFVEDHWTSLDKGDQETYLMYMTDAWREKS